MNRARAWTAAHRKLLAAIAGAALTIALQVWGPDNPWVSLAVLAASAAGVYQLPNTPGSPRTRTGPPPALLPSTPKRPPHDRLLPQAPQRPGAARNPANPQRNGSERVTPKCILPPPR